MKFVIEWVQGGVMLSRFVDGCFAGKAFGLTVCESVRQFGIRPEQAQF